MAGRWVDVGVAARELGISTDAVRKRIARGSLESDRPNGHVLVWLDGGRTEAGQDAPGEDRGALVEMLTDQVTYLRSQLDQERQAHAEARRIIGGLVQRVPELEAQVQQPTPPEDREEPAQDAANGAGGTQPHAGGNGSQNGPKRSWWKRVFGG